MTDNKKSLHDQCVDLLFDWWNDKLTARDCVNSIALIGYKIGATEGMGLLLTKEQKEFIKDAKLNLEDLKNGGQLC